MAKSIPALLQSYDLSPRKRLGQNFLTDPVAAQRIVSAASLSSEDTVVEVGSGLGILTRLLAEQSGQVLAVELDDGLVRVLHDQLADLSNVRIVHGDILRLPDLGMSHLAYKVVGNLPYYITSAVLRHFLEKRPRPRLMVVTVQREVAERIVAQPGRMSLLAVSVQFYGRPCLVARISPGAFYPSPQVDSAVLRVEIGDQPVVSLSEGVEESTYFRVVRAGFSQRRKTLRNSLSGGLALSPEQVEEALGKAGIDSRRRAETLDLQEWAQAAQTLSGWLSA